MYKLNKFLFISLLFVSSIGVAQQQVSVDVTALKAELKPLLKPNYKYDSSTATKYTSKIDKQVKEIEVPLFMGEKYRFLFNTKEAGEIEINIYDKPVSKGKRTLLYSSKNEKSVEKIYTFEPDKSRKMYINYVIPAIGNGETSGCIVFMLGYKF